MYRTGFAFQGAQEEVGTAVGVYCREEENWILDPVGDREFVVNFCFDNDQDDDQQKNAKNRPVEM